jgi:hypothetical protein
LREEQRFNVVATLFTKAAVGKMRLHPKPTGSISAVRDNPDDLVSELTSADAEVTSADVVVEIFIVSDDDEPFLGEHVADSVGIRLRRLGVLRVLKLT